MAPARVTYEVPYLAAFREATEGARMRTMDVWVRLMAPLFLAAAILLLGIAIVYGSLLFKGAG